MALRWLCDGSAMALRWPCDGSEMALRWADRPSELVLSRGWSIPNKIRLGARRKADLRGNVDDEQSGWADFPRVDGRQACAHLKAVRRKDKFPAR